MRVDRNVANARPTGDAAHAGPTRTIPSGRVRTDWAAWSKAWGGVVVTAFVNGALHRGYATALGEPAATRLSEVVLPLLLAPWVLRVERRHPLPSGAAAVVVGAGWGAATVAFEFLFGRYVIGDSWQTLRAAYDLSAGRLWMLDVLLIAAAPALVRARRRRRSRADRGRTAVRR
jgi:hypothetical protein